MNALLKLKKHKSIVIPGVVLTAFFGIGIGYLLLAKAATPYVSLEPENGTRTGNAAIIADNTASGSSSIKFAAPSAPARPSASNTGVPVGTTLTPVSGNLTITTDNTVIDSKDISGFVIIQANNVTIKRSIIRGGIATANASIIAVNSGTNILLEDIEISVAHPSAFIDGISGSNMTVRRANIHGSVDGMKAYSNSHIENSYIHDLTYFASDPNHGGGPTHNDTIQILSGTNISITNNALVTTKDMNSAIQITQDFGAVSGVNATGNYMDGGACTVNASHNGGPAMSGITFTDNRFGRNSYFNCPILASTQTTLTLSGNVWDDTSAAVPVQQHD